MVNRKLFRHSITEMKEPFPVRPAAGNAGGGNSGGPAPRKKPAPPEQTHAENFYYVKQMQSRSPVAVVLLDGETLRGTLESISSTLDPKIFVRINRGSLVRLDAIRELQPWFHGEYKVILKDATELRWSRRYVKQRPELLKLS